MNEIASSNLTVNDLLPYPSSRAHDVIDARRRERRRSGGGVEEEWGRRIGTPQREER